MMFGVRTILFYEAFLDLCLPRLRLGSDPLLETLEWGPRGSCSGETDLALTTNR